MKTAAVTTCNAYILPGPSIEASVLTLVRDRQFQLDNFLAALRHQSHKNFEVIVAYMQRDAPKIAEDLPFPVRTVSVPGAELPLALARNSAAAAARGELLIFLDVDCIASPGLVARYALGLREYDACLMGEVRYLPAETSTTVDAGYSALCQRAVDHPARPQLCAEGLHPEHNPRALWGLSFALRRTRFFAAGGLDTSYSGYGGEETDFALRLQAIGSRFAWISHAQALHQWHPTHRPPLNHFHAIIDNAARFHARWQSWCLEYWLEAFVRMRLIEWSIDSDRISLLREPSAEELASAVEHSVTRAF